MGLKCFLRKRNFANFKDGVPSAKTLYVDLFQSDEVNLRFDASKKSKNESLSDKINSMPKKYFCRICVRDYPLVYFRRHQIRHEWTIRCNFCYQRLTERGFKRHTCLEMHRNIHSNNKLRRRSKLDAHFRMHSRIDNRNPLLRTLPCSEKLAGDCRDVANGEISQEYKSLNNGLKCTYCDKISTNRWKYDMHHRMHIKKQKFHCGYCNDTFQYLVHLARHISVVHKKIDSSKTECPICKKMVSAINAHLRTHQDSPMNCETCGATLRNYSAYKAHTRYHRILSSKGRDRAIVPKTTTPKENVNRCITCDKSFLNRQHLVSHLKTHIQVALFPCPYCDYDSCCTQEEIVIHVSSVHQAIPHSYSQCPHCANICSDIKSHLKSHETALYQCDLCDSATFARETLYRKHFNRKHRRFCSDWVIFFSRCCTVADA